MKPRENPDRWSTVEDLCVHLPLNLTWEVVKQNPNTKKISSPWSLPTKLGLLSCRSLGVYWNSYRYTEAPASIGGHINVILCYCVIVMIKFWF